MASVALLNPDDDLTPEEAARIKADLLRRFHECFQITEESFVRAAGIVAEWQRYNFDVADLRDAAGKWFHRLRQIAEGKLLPKLAYHFHAEPGRIDRFARYPAADQLAIATDQPVLVLIDGGKDQAMLSPSRVMDQPELSKQVFDRDHIRDDQEQRAYLLNQQAKEERQRTDLYGTFRLNLRDGTARPIGCKPRTLAEYEGLVMEMKRRLRKAGG